ncbi:hypothetical protein B0T22DRAFT_472839 [Podospora appendiculata]|uniref:Uncharacterized protein n=1 Tax=Podospora appendiculata TaxID=314037 RepID=A0AAE1C7N3_9PEZI|nr:hypothetical protein B0T22DRAFT_472839 [Podospora appendiculata]
MSNQAQPPLLTLPVEILHDIIAQPVLLRARNPKSRCGWQDAVVNYEMLGGLSETCRALRQFVLPLLYRRVNFNCWQTDLTVALLRHFARNPEYALFVRSATVFMYAHLEYHYTDEDWRYGGSEEGWDSSEEDYDDTAKLKATNGRHLRPDVRLLRREAHRLGIPLPTTIHMSDEMDPQIMDHLLLRDVLILTQIPNVEDLTLILDDRRHDWAHYLPESLVFASLRRVRLQSSMANPRYVLWLDRLSGLLNPTRMPTLERVAMERDWAIVSPWMRPLSLWTCYHPFKHVTCVNIERADLELFQLEAMLTLFPRLQSFRYRAAFDLSCILPGRDPEGKFLNFVAQDICRALLPVKATLKRLDLDLCNRTGPAMRDDFAMDLSEFTMLERLSLDIYDTKPQEGGPDMLVNLLPPRIRWFSLNARWKAMAPKIHRLAKHIRAGGCSTLADFEYQLAKPFLGEDDNGGPSEEEMGALFWGTPGLTLRRNAYQGLQPAFFALDSYWPYRCTSRLNGYDPGTPVLHDPMGWEIDELELGV